MHQYQVIRGLGWGTQKGARKHTSSSKSIEADSPWHAERREALDQTDDRRFAAQVCIPGSWVPQKACSARRRDDLALASLVSALVALVQQLEESEHGVVQRGAIERVGVRELVHWRVPSVLNEVRQGVSRLQIFEHGPRHSCISDENVDIADFAAYLG